MFDPMCGWLGELRAALVAVGAHEFAAGGNGANVSAARVLAIGGAVEPDLQPLKALHVVPHRMRRQPVFLSDRVSKTTHASL